MPNIVNFSTTKDVLKQLDAANAEIKLGFSATKMKSKKDPFKSCKDKVKYKDGKEYKWEDNPNT